MNNIIINRRPKIKTLNHSVQTKTKLFSLFFSYFSYFLLLSIIILLPSTKSFASVWEDAQPWSPYVEHQYSKWVHDHYHIDIFIKGPYAGIATDCAKSVYFSRLIFAYENKLPFSIKDPTNSKGIISNKMGRWDSLSEEQRLRKFIIYIGQLVSTVTIPNDTYPIAVNRNWIRPGTVFRTSNEKSNHAGTLTSLSETGVMYIISSTTPNIVRQLQAFSFYMPPPRSTKDGLRWWILPENRSLPFSKQPGYNLDQYNLYLEPIYIPTERIYKVPEDAWVKAVQKQLQIREESKAEVISRLVADICQMLKERAKSVIDAQNYIKQIGGRCMNASEYDGYSTPSRDRVIREKTNLLLAAAKTNSLEPLTYALDTCKTIDIGFGKNISLKNYLKKAQELLPSANPNDSFLARWGEFEPYPKQNHCPQY